MNIAIINNTNRFITGRLFFVVPDGWSIDINGLNIELPPYKRQIINFVITIKNVELLYDKNILKISLSCMDKTIFTHDFGLCGTPVCRVSGPFFDSYEEWPNLDGISSTRNYIQTKTGHVLLADGTEEWCNHRVNIDKEYVNEKFLNEIYTSAVFFSGKYVNIFNDNYSVKDAFGLHGPCCIYYFQEIVSNGDKNVIMCIGSTDPYKIWLNGELIISQNECRFWMPLNNTPVVKFNRGANQIILKTIRCGEDNKFSLSFREYNEGSPPRHDVTPFITDFAYNAFLALPSRVQ
jgi:hypothetical protein